MKLAEPHWAHLSYVLLLDTSSSMAGDPIHDINMAVSEIIKRPLMDEYDRRRIDVAVVEFNDKARVVQEFTPLSDFQPVSLSASGNTAMGEGINLAIDMVKERAQLYESLGVPYFRPWIIMISDGFSTDDITNARTRIQKEENEGKIGSLEFWAIGVGNINKDVLRSLTERLLTFDEKEYCFPWTDGSSQTIGTIIEYQLAELEDGGLPDWDPVFSDKSKCDQPKPSCPTEKVCVIPSDW